MSDEQDPLLLEVADLLVRAATDRVLAQAIELVVGGSATCVIEDEDRALIDSFIAVHGAAHLLSAVERHHRVVAEQHRLQEEARAREAEIARAEAKALEARQQQAEDQPKAKRGRK